MKKIGCVFMLIGLLPFIGGLVTFGWMVKRDMDANRVAVVPLTLGSKATSDLITVNTEKLCGVGYSVEFFAGPGKKGDTAQSDSALNSTPTHGSPTWPHDAVQSDFTLNFTVFDEDGQEIASGAHGIDRVPKRNKTVRFVSYSLANFQVGPSGKIRVEGEIGPGSYASDLKCAELTVWDNVTDPAIFAISGLAMLLLGAVIGFVGMVFFVFGFIKGRKNAAGPPIHFTGVRESS